MRPLLLASLLFALAASAAPELTRVTPASGFTFTDTFVMIEGRGFVTEEPVDCHLGSPCPVEVFFGERPGRVARVLLDRVFVAAPQQRDGTRVDIRVRLENGSERTLPNAFVYSDEARPENNYRQYLVPLTVPEARGAHGSIWRTELIAHNAWYLTVPLLTSFCGGSTTAAAPCNSPRLETNATRTVALAPRAGGEGAFLYVPTGAIVAVADEIDFKLLVRDVSRGDDNWGIEVPVVPVGEQFRTIIQLLGVPVDPRFRLNLRVYLHEEFTHPVDMLVFREEGGAPIDERTIRLNGLTASPFREFPLAPASAQLDPISDAVRASGAARVRIELRSQQVPRVDPGYVPPIWAFVSVTNNSTQQVTTITPHDR